MPSGPVMYILLLQTPAAHVRLHCIFPPLPGSPSLPSTTDLYICDLVRLNRGGQNWCYIFVYWKIQMVLTSYSVKSDWLFITQSIIQYADRMIMGNNEKTTLHINMPYLGNFVEILCIAVMSGGFASFS